LQHTYCKDCVESIKTANFNKMTCTVCKVAVQRVYANRQLESLVEQFGQRKLLTIEILKWVQRFSVGNSLDVE
jgi:hypothetical protein